MSDIAHCHRCLIAHKTACAGPCPCPYDGGDVSRHVELRYCPHPKGPLFGTAAKPDHWDEVAKLPLAPPQPSVVLAVPESQWPMIVRIVARQKKPGDAGVGDTAKRVLAHLSAEALAWLFEKATGRPCGCQNRQARLNETYPYAPIE